ncbi:MAG: DsbA oxidoreductase [Candidatus Gottesmanbacteria bacterium GW2011_GWC2_39_8]|uniref:DsbA oxidoreductase n=1 Tax=Candidatus Gottesmanbacteria bacterium GW2011_GWC2_39_8 TaxID=1618450 RepID=A0A0G0Q518_9BACT|nr:MAG: DsbA oxidoreductase [Candidatus Gottesmanbacteria bacterium GW2011_GWC2_39_8]
MAERENNQKTVVYLLLGLLVIAAFLLGSLYTKVQMLEKGGVTKETVEVKTATPTRKPVVDWKKLPKLSDYCTQKEKITTNKFPVSRTKVQLTDKDVLCGNPDAKVTVVEFSDYQCPFCGALSGLNLEMVANMKSRSAAWEPLEENLLKEYIKTGKVNFVFKDYPFLGEESNFSAEATRCAGDQDKYWLYHDYLFSHQSGENQGAFSKDNLKSFAKEIGLNTTDFNKCLDSGKYQKLVAENKEEGNKNGVNGTPASFVNGTLIGGASSYSTFKAAIEDALKK